MTPSTKGKKHICTNCEVRYFDLDHLPATCPKCGTVDEKEKPKKSSKKSPKPEPIVESVPSPVKSDEKAGDDLEDIEITDDDKDDDGLIEDTSDLEDEDLPEVIQLNGDSEINT